MQKWAKYWMAWTNPLRYAFESILTLQLHGKIMDCSNMIPSGDSYTDIPSTSKVCAWLGASIGNDFVRGDEYLDAAFGYSFAHVWRNLGILFGFAVGFLVIEAVGVELCMGYNSTTDLSLKLIVNEKNDF
ncbi:unnamed protein product [Ambrosiozyma monospora]|uniref:Unnamed protein product n=1 Tax=Ambrosiozyma monospora TaxID=43982 RepID=A0ACB5UD40_AMBMO|nr:unnamed protein product [Ambrosiozyma monospora]